MFKKEKIVLTLVGLVSFFSMQNDGKSNPGQLLQFRATICLNHRAVEQQSTSEMGCAPVIFNLLKFEKSGHEMLLGNKRYPISSNYYRYLMRFGIGQGGYDEFNVTLTKEAVHALFEYTLTEGVSYWRSTEHANWVKTLAEEVKGQYDFNKENIAEIKHRFTEVWINGGNSRSYVESTEKELIYSTVDSKNQLELKIYGVELCR